MPPLASVIIPVYNNGRHIIECLESVCSQTYPALEIIVVDDGSTDDTPARAQAFASRGVTVVAQPNQGPSGAINRGFELAKGDVLLLHGGDDVSFPGRIEHQVRLLAETGADIVACRPKIIDDKGAPLPIEVFPHFEREPPSFAANDMLGELFFGLNFICAPTVAMTRATRIELGEAHVGLMQLQDFDYWLRATARGWTLHIDAEPLLAYRVHDGNLSGPANNARCEKETIYVLSRIGRLLDASQIVALLEKRASGFFVREPASVPREIVLPFLYVNHVMPSVRQIGFDMLLDLIADPASERLLATHLGFVRHDLFRLLLAP